MFRSQLGDWFSPPQLCRVHPYSTGCTRVLQVPPILSPHFCRVHPYSAKSTYLKKWTKSSRILQGPPIFFPYSAGSTLTLHGSSTIHPKESIRESGEVCFMYWLKLGLLPKMALFSYVSVNWRAVFWKNSWRHLVRFLLSYQSARINGHWLSQSCRCILSM